MSNSFSVFVVNLKSDAGPELARCETDVSEKSDMHVKHTSARLITDEQRHNEHRQLMCGCLTVKLTSPWCVFHTTTCRWNRKKSLTTSLIPNLLKSNLNTRCLRGGFVYALLQHWRLDIISEWLLKVWERPPKSNKHQGRPPGSWPEAPVCSWEWRQTLDDPSAIWDREHTNKALIQKGCGILCDTKGNTALFLMLSFLLSGVSFPPTLWSAQQEPHSSTTICRQVFIDSLLHIRSMRPHLWVVGLMLIFPGSLQDSNLLAKVTLFPKRQ